MQALAGEGERLKINRISKIKERWNINSLDDILPGQKDLDQLGQSAIQLLQGISSKVSLPAARLLLAASCQGGPITHKIVHSISVQLSADTPAKPSKAKAIPGTPADMAGSSETKPTVTRSENNLLGSMKKKDSEPGTLGSKVGPPTI
jgi:hypothetical protein